MMTKLNALVAAAALGLSFTSTAALADAQQYTYNVGSTFDSGATFSKTITRQIGPGWSFVNVQLNGFSFDFRYDDHHIDRTMMFIDSTSYNPYTGLVSFRIHGAYDDKNNDDDYYWDGRYTILAMD